MDLAISIVETVFGVLAWIAIASIGGFVLWLMANALAAFMLSSRISRERNEQEGGEE